MAQAGTVSADLIISPESLAAFSDSASAAAQQVGEDLSTQLSKGGEAGGKEAGAALSTGISSGAEEGTTQAQSSVTSLGTTIAKVAGAAILADFFKNAVESAEAAEVRTRKIETALQDTNFAAGVTVDEINKMASSLSQVDGVSAGVIKSADLILLKFTNIRNVGDNKIFDKATASVLDFAAGMNIDASTAAQTLGKALNNPLTATRALANAGIVLTAVEKDKIKQLVISGDLLDAQSLLLDKVNQRFAGQAAAAATPLDRLHIELGRFSTSIGQGMLPFVDAGTKALTGIIHEFEQLPAPVQSVLALFGTGAYVIGAFGQQIVAAKTLLAPVAAHVAAIASALTDYVTGAISGAAASEGLTAAFTTQAAAEYATLAAQTGMSESALLASVGNETLAASAEALAAAEADAAAAAGALDIAFPPLAIAAAIVAAALVVFTHSGGGVAKVAKDMADSVEKTGQALDEVFRVKVTNAIKGSSDLAAALERSHLSANDMLAAINAGGSSLDAFIKQLTAGGGNAFVLAGGVHLLASEYNKATKDLADYAKAQHAADEGNPTQVLSEQAAATQSLGQVLFNAAVGSGKFAAALSALGPAADTAQAAGLNLRQALSDTSDAGTKFQSAIAAVTDGAKQDAIAQLQHGASIGEVEANLKTAAQAAYDWAIQNQLGAGVAGTLSSSILGIGTSADVAKAAVGGLTQSISDYLDKINGVKANADTVNTAFNQLTTAAHDAAAKGVNLGQAYTFLNGNFKDTSDAAISYRTALDGVIAKELDHVRAVEQDDYAHHNFTGAVQDAQVALLEAAKRTYDSTYALTGNAQAAADARDKVLGFSGSLDALPAAANASTAAVQALQNTIDGLHDKTVTINTFVNMDALNALLAKENQAQQGLTILQEQDSINRAANFPGRASGGAVTRGDEYLVGEYGPERFVPNKSGTIVPNGPQGLGAGPAKAAFEFNGPVTFGSEDVLPDLDWFARTRLAGV